MATEFDAGIQGKAPPMAPGRAALIVLMDRCLAAFLDSFITLLELLGTVHWVATRNGATTFDEVMRETYAWNRRKFQFTKHHLGVAWDVLHEKSWLSDDRQRQYD